MPIAAVPEYMRKDDEQFYLWAPPGHRFTLYFPVWGWDKARSAPTWGVDETAERKKKDSWVPEKVSNKAWACTLAAGKKPDEGPDLRRHIVPRHDEGLRKWKHLLDGLIARQTALLAHTPCAYVLQATAIAPFTTGLGNEHPLENGFAFLNPYGLPYLPGSGVKGVVRQAAQELASGQWGDTKGWSEEHVYPLMQGEGERAKPVIDERTKQPILLSILDVLFGRETKDGDTGHVRGALSFWDVIPQIAGESLMVEIMTPHQSHYYQQTKERRSGDSDSPHDSGQPNPICFLTVPPGSGFTFHVVCDRQHLARLTQRPVGGAPDLLGQDEHGKPRWQTLLEAAFQHAFEWLGFGAKTAVGYGAMKLTGATISAGASDQQDPATPTTPPSKPAASALQAQEEIWANVALTYHRGGAGTVKVEGEQRKAEASGAQAKALLDQLTPDQRKQLEKKGRLTPLTVVVTIEGNKHRVKRVLPEGPSA